MKALCRLSQDRRGVTAVEFAVVAPVMLMVIFGLMELVFQSYVQVTLDGAVNAAARSATVENSSVDQSAADATVRNQVRSIARSANLAFERKNYVSVSDIGKAEIYTDSKEGPLKNGRYDLGECFIDYNRNGVWDRDRGRSGQGGANDFIDYKVTATYPRFFPMGLLGMSNVATLTSTSVLRNQPYAGQATAGSTQVCS